MSVNRQIATQHINLNGSALWQDTKHSKGTIKLNDNNNNNNNKINMVTVTVMGMAKKVLHSKDS